MSSKGGSQTKTTNVTAVHSSQPVTTRGKRRLDFDRELYAFRGKTLFFDLSGYKHIDKLENELTQRGGTVVKFFQRGVKYLVTNRPQGDKKSGQSPSTPSPCTPGTNGSKGASTILSPVMESPDSNESSGKSVRPLEASQHSRTAKIMAASKLKQGNKKSVDMFALAKTWGCKVVSLTEILKELQRLKPLPKKDEGKKGCENGKVYKLKAPFLKVEDQSQLYRPLVYETRQWPRPNPRCSPKSSPYDTPRTAKNRDDGAIKDGDRSGGPLAVGARGTTTTMVTKEKRPGYCECCTTRFEDLEMHLRSTKHQEYASNPDNFFSLDKLISQGTNFSDFVTSLKAKRGKKGRGNATSSPAKDMNTEMDLVVLVTPPSAPCKTNKPTASPRTPSKSSPKRLSPRKPPPTRSSPRREAAALGRKKITLSSGSYSSPKQGELCIKPVMETAKMTSPSQTTRRNKNYTPGFSTPSSTNQHLRSGLKRGRGFSDSEDTPISKRPRRNAVCHGSPRKLEVSELVPETPEKPTTVGRNQVNSSPLCNITSVLDRIYHHKPQTPPTGRSQLLTDLQTLLDDVTGESPSGIRRSPRLREKVCPKKLTVTTEGVKVFIPPGSDSLVVSFKLSDVYLNNTGRGVANSSVCGSGITPEIRLQCLPPSRVLSSPVSSNESPLFGQRSLNCHTPFDHSSSDASAFLGFSSEAVRKALPDFVSSKFTRRSSKPCLDDIAMKLMSRATQKRWRESYSPQQVSSVSKRRRISPRSSPRRSGRLSAASSPRSGGLN